MGSNAVTTRTRSSRQVVTTSRMRPREVCAEVEIAFLPFDDLHTEIHRVIKDNLLRFVRLDPMARDVPYIRFISNSIGGSSTHFLLYFFCRYIMPMISSATAAGR